MLLLKEISRKFWLIPRFSQLGYMAAAFRSGFARYSSVSPYDACFFQSTDVSWFRFGHSCLSP